MEASGMRGVRGPAPRTPQAASGLRWLFKEFFFVPGNLRGRRLFACPPIGVRFRVA